MAYGRFSLLELVLFDIQSRWGIVFRTLYVSLVENIGGIILLLFVLICPFGSFTGLPYDFVVWRDGFFCSLWAIRGGREEEEREEKWGDGGVIWSVRITLFAPLKERHELLDFFFFPIWATW